MSLGDRLRRRPGSQTCAACGSRLVAEATFCHVCGVRVDDPDAQPLHIVDRLTGLFNDRFVRPILDDELSRSFRYGRALGVLLVQAAPLATAGVVGVATPAAALPAAADGAIVVAGSGATARGGSGSSVGPGAQRSGRSGRSGTGASPAEEEEDKVLQAIGGAIARTLRDVDTPGVISHHPPTILALLPDTDLNGTAHAAARVVEATDQALAPLQRRTALGIVCCVWRQRLRATTVIEAAQRALETDRPELLGR
jgi:hypothetical protein